MRKQAGRKIISVHVVCSRLSRSVLMQGPLNESFVSIFSIDWVDAEKKNRQVYDGISLEPEWSEQHPGFLSIVILPPVFTWSKSRICPD